MGAASNPRRVVLAVIIIVALGALLLLLMYPAWEKAAVKGEAAVALSAMRQLSLVMQNAELDGYTSGEPRIGLPADVGARSVKEYLRPLVAGNYILAEDVDRLVSGNHISIANISKDDPADTAWLFARDGWLLAGSVQSERGRRSLSATIRS